MWCCNASLPQGLFLHDSTIVRVCSVFFPLHLDSIWNCIKFCTFSFSTRFNTHLCSFVFIALVIICVYYPCHCITLRSIFVLLRLVVCHIVLYKFSIEGYVPCWLRFQMLAIHCSTMFLFLDWKQMETIRFELLLVDLSFC